MTDLFTEGRPYEQSTGRPLTPPVPEARPEVVSLLIQSNFASVVGREDQHWLPRRHDGIGFARGDMGLLRTARKSKIEAWRRWWRREVDAFAWEQQKRERIADFLSAHWGHEGLQRLRAVIAELPTQVRRELDALMAEQSPGPRSSL